MTEKQLKSGLRLSHRWVGAVAAALLVVTAVTGILLQHPTWLGPQANPTLSLTADPWNGGRLFRGTHWGVELSEDGGRTWRELPMLEAPTDVVTIVFAPDDSLLVYALGAEALVVSRDGGRIWQDLTVDRNDLRPEVVFRDLTVGPGGSLHLLTDVGLLGSLDGGNSWNRIGPGEEPETGNWYRLVHDLHTGHLVGTVGRRVSEAGALALVFITVTGVLLYRRNGRFLRK